MTETTQDRTDAWEAVGNLVREAQRGSASAWTELVARFSPTVLAIARRYRLIDSDVDDVFQIVWLRLAERLDTLEDPRRLAGWLAATTRNESLRVIERATRTDRLYELDVTDGRPTLDSRLTRSETVETVALAFAALDDRCRALLRAVVVDRTDYERVAVQLDMPVGSIGPTRRRCLNRLKELLPAAEVEFA